MKTQFTWIKDCLSKNKTHVTCEMCGGVSYTYRFLWVGMFTGTKCKVCLKCAYREEFGTKGQIQKKRDKVLETHFGIN